MSDARAILVAEDSPTDTLLLKRAFSRAGIELPITFLQDGQEMIEHLQRMRTAGGSPTLVMLDLAMPKLGGLEVLGWIRQQPDLSRIPVVVFSGLNRPVDISRAYALGANLFLIKTTDPRQWTAVMRRLGELYGLMPEPVVQSPPE